VDKLDSDSVELLTGGVGGGLHLVDHLEQFFFLEFAFGCVILLLLLFVLEECLEVVYFVGFGLYIVLLVDESQVAFLHLLLFQL
jgi:hypothetical protein